MAEFIAPLSLTQINSLQHQYWFFFYIPEVGAKKMAELFKVL